MADTKKSTTKKSDFPAMKLQPETTYVVAHRSEGELKFETDADGKVTPTTQAEHDALVSLGAKEAK